MSPFLSYSSYGGGASGKLVSGGSGGGELFDDLLALTSTLAAGAVATGTNFQGVQATIESANPAFNVFAVVGNNDFAENLSGTGTSGGKRTHTVKGFNYNSSSSNIISTGNTIVSMAGGESNGLSAIDGKKWMAMAQYDGSSFDGILLWIFTGDSVNNGGSITSGARGVNNVRDIFYPVGTNDAMNYHHIYPIAIQADGTVYSNTQSGKCGWNFSNGSGASNLGHNSVDQLSGDDGAWGFIIPTGSNGGYVDGNSPGETWFSTASGKPGFGMGNHDSGDSNADTYWNGVNTSSTNNVGFVFSGDA